MKTIPTEAKEQEAFVQWLSLNGWMFTATAQATPAGSMRGGSWKPNFATLRKNKQIGVRKGFPDLCAVSPDSRVLFVEMKRSNGVPSDVGKEQMDWLTALNLSNVPAALACGAGEAIALCQAFHRNGLWEGRLCRVDARFDVAKVGFRFFHA